VEKSPPVEVAKAVETRLAEIIGFLDSGLVEGGTPVKPVSTPSRRPDLYDAPSFRTIQPRQPGKLRFVLLAVAALVVFGASALLTEHFWMRRPPLTLTSSELDGSLVIHWNPEALRGIDHASMFVNDGGQPVPSVIPLDRFQLNSGLLSYTPKSKRVTAKLEAGETSAVVAWFAPVPSAPVPPASATPAPAKPAPPSRLRSTGKPSSPAARPAPPNAPVEASQTSPEADK
jgi:hypothetical protein